MCVPVCFLYLCILDKNNQGTLVMNKNDKFVITVKYHRDWGGIYREINSQIALSWYFTLCSLTDLCSCHCLMFWFLVEFQLWNLLCQVYFEQEVYPCILWISGRHLLLPFPNLIPSRINLWSHQAQPEFLSELSSKSQHGSFTSHFLW